MATKFNIGRNVEVSVDGKKMTITADIGEQGQPSSTGKTDLIASSGGAQAVGSLPDGRPVKLNLALFAPVAK